MPQSDAAMVTCFNDATPAFVFFSAEENEVRD